MSIQTFGLDAFRATIDQALDLAREAAARVEASPELELLAPVDLSIVALRRRPAGETDERRLDAINLALVARGGEVGRRAASRRPGSSGGTAIRMCVVNPTTTAAHIHRVLDIIEHTPLEALDLGRPPWPSGVTRSSYPAGRRVPAWEREELGWVPLFAALTPADASALVARAQQRRIEAGELLIEQWDAGREVFVIIDGTFAVRSDGRRLAAVGPGDFVGELAALDWGAGYGTLRTARVETQTQCTLLALTPALLREALTRSRGARELVERTARERLALMALE